MGDRDRHHAGRRAVDQPAAAGAVPRHRADPHLDQRHLPGRVGQDHRGFGHAGDRAAAQGAGPAHLHGGDQQLVGHGSCRADVRGRHRPRRGADAGAEQAAAGDVAVAAAGAGAGRLGHQGRHRSAAVRRAVFRGWPPVERRDRRLPAEHPDRCDQPRRRRRRCGHPRLGPRNATVAGPRADESACADAVGHPRGHPVAEHRGLGRPDRGAARAAGTATHRHHHGAQQAADGRAVPRGRRQVGARRVGRAAGRGGAGRARRRELQHQHPVQRPDRGRHGDLPGQRRERPEGGGRRAGQAGDAGAVLPERAEGPDRLRHHAVRAGLDRGGREDAVRGDAAGRAGDVPVPAEPARHAGAGDRGAGGAARHLRHPGGVRLLDQHADDVRRRAGDRSAGRRRDRRGRERRAADGRGRPVAARGDAQVDGPDHRRADRHRAGAVGGVHPDGLLRRIDRRDLSPVLDHHRVGDAAVGAGGGHFVPGAVRHPAEAGAGRRRGRHAPRRSTRCDGTLLQRLQPRLRPQRRSLPARRRRTAPARQAQPAGLCAAGGRLGGAVRPLADGFPARRGPGHPATADQDARRIDRRAAAAGDEHRRGLPGEAAGRALLQPDHRRRRRSGHWPGIHRPGRLERARG